MRMFLFYLIWIFRLCFPDVMVIFRRRQRRFWWILEWVLSTFSRSENEFKYFLYRISAFSSVQKAKKCLWRVECKSRKRLNALFRRSSQMNIFMGVEKHAWKTCEIGEKSWWRRKISYGKKFPCKLKLNFFLFTVAGFYSYIGIFDTEKASQSWNCKNFSIRLLPWLHGMQSPCSANSGWALEHDDNETPLRSSYTAPTLHIFSAWCNW